MKDIAKLKAEYRVVVNEYIKLFCKKQDIEFDLLYAIGDRVGELYDYDGDYVFDFRDIKTDIDMVARKDEIFDWSDYCRRLDTLGAEYTINYESWLKGAPRKSEKEIQAAERIYDKINEMKELLKSEVN